MGRTFKCPLCHTSHPIEDCEIDERFIKSKHTGSTIRGRFAVHSFVDTYRYVRLCHSCSKKQKITRIVIKVLLFGILPLLYLIFNYNVIIDKNGIAGTIMLILVLVFIASILNAITNRILEHSVFDIDYEQAENDNALLIGREIDEYKKNNE